MCGPPGVDRSTWISLGISAGGGGFLVLCNFISARWSRRLENRRDDQKTLSTEGIAERLGLLANWEVLVKSLQARLEAGENEQRTMRALFSAVQVALAACEQAHRDDADKISALQWQNREQAEQIKELQRHSAEIISDITGKR